MSAPLYTLANFTCEGIGDVLEWSIQGNSLNDSIKQYREISVTTNNISVDVWSSVLTIRALPINDGITVGCNVVSFNLYHFTQKGTTLTVEGIIQSCYHYTKYYLTGALPVESVHFTFNVTSSSSQLT